MKLISLHIDAFGKLRNFDLSFEDGITEVLGENGYGKTTLASFIKAMLYGLPNNRAKDKARKNYAPWSGGDFGGYIDIETEKGRYRVSRRFSLTANDSFELLSLETNLPSEDYSENIGFELFYLDADSYEKSVYLPQNRVDIKMTDKIGARMTALLEGSDDMADFSAAIEKIRDRRRELELYRGQGGLIDSARTELSLSEARIAEAETRLKSADKLRTDAEALAAEAEQIKNDISLLSERIKEENERRIILKDHEIYRDLSREAEDCRGKAESLEAKLEKGIPSTEEIDDAENTEREIVFSRKRRAEMLSNSAQNSQIKELDGVFEKHTPSAYELAERGMDARSIIEKRAELDRLEAELPKEGEKPLPKKINRGAVFAAVGGALLVVGACLFALSLPAAIAFVVAGVAFGGYSALLMSKAKKEKEEAEKTAAKNAELKKSFEEKKRELASLEERFEEYLSGYKMTAIGKDPQRVMQELAAAAEEYERESKSRRGIESDVRALDAEIAKKEQKLSAFLEKYGFSGENEMSASEIRALTDELARTKAELVSKLEKAERFKKDKNLSEDFEEPTVDIAELESALKNAQSILNANEAQRSRLTERAEQYESGAEGLPELKDKRTKLEEKIREYTKKRDICDNAEKFLSEAKENLSSRYITKMKESFASRFDPLTDNEKEITLDAKLEIKLRDEGGAKKAELYSTGWQEIIAICLRLALIDSLYADERPFLILDDPFVNLDGKKLERAIAMLRELSHGRQIIYLTCHESRSTK